MAKEMKLKLTEYQLKLLSENYVLIMGKVGRRPIVVLLGKEDYE